MDAPGRIAEPFVEQRFKNAKEVEEYYQKFSRQEGFEVKIRSSRKHTKSNELSSIFLCCKKYGHPIEKSLNFEDDDDKGGKKISKVRDVIVKTNCEARLFAKHDVNKGDWVVSTYVRNHNHILVSPQKRNLIQTHKNISPVSTSLIEVFDNANLGANKMLSVFKEQAGGLQNVPFTDRNIRNKLRDIRGKNDVGNDVSEALSYLHKLNEESGGQSFYTYRLDVDNHVDILLWIDGRSKLAYQKFGDVISFDTTYRTNKFGMPFAPFTGINHHFQSITFGYGLLGKETEESFTWLFNAWLEAMNNVQPKIIITDQDKAMAQAITNVFPDTRHFLCYWHISKKFPQYLNSLYAKFPNFKSEFDTCVLKSLSTDEFEGKWSKLTLDYHLHDHGWLQTLYGLKDKWVPAYIKRYFAAGMNTTQRSESMNSKFDKLVSSYYTITDFVKKSIVAIDEDCLKEKTEDFHTSNKSRNLVHGSPLEAHASTLYTRELFKVFQTEICKTNAMTLSKDKDQSTDGVKVYSVWNTDGSRQHRVFKVNIVKEGGKYKCSCLMFEHQGMLCRHIIRVLISKGVTEIPNSLILSRWTRDANKINGKSIYSSPAKTVDFEDSQVMRYNHLSLVLNGVASDASNKHLTNQTKHKFRLYLQ